MIPSITFDQVLVGGRFTCSVAGEPAIPDLGTKYLVPSSWYQVLGTKYLVPSTWYQVLGTQYLVPSTWYQILGTGVPGTQATPVEKCPRNFFTGVVKTSISKFPAMAEPWNPDSKAPPRTNCPGFFPWGARGQDHPGEIIPQEFSVGVQRKVENHQKKLGTIRKQLETTQDKS